MVSQFKLTPAAELGLEEIALYTDETFGPNQTAAYMAGLNGSFELLAQFPGIGVACFELKPGLRRYRYQSHSIYYTVQDESVWIEALFHIRRRIRADLFDN